MADFIISPYAISYESIRNNLQTFVSSKSDDSTWKDFYAASAGETVIELAAALGAFYAYQFITGRREVFMANAQNYTSLLGLAQNLGYSASRGNNLKMKINITPNVTQTLSKWTIVGTYGEYDLVLTEDAILNKGVNTDISVVIGDLKQQSQLIDTNDLTTFTFTNSDVTDDFYLCLNEREVPVSTQLKDAANDCYVTLSNIYGAIDVFYLQQGSNHELYQVGTTNKTGWVTVSGDQGESVASNVKIYSDQYLKEFYVNDGTFTYSGDTINYTYYYRANDTLYLNFIERNNLKYANFTSDSLSITYASQINEQTLIEDHVDMESSESIRLKGPIYHETSMIIRSRKDYCKYLLQNNSNIIQVNDKDIYPGLIAMTYITEDGSNLTSDEKNYWLDQIDQVTPSGVAKALIEDSVLIKKNLTISLWKSSSENIPATIEDDIQAILDEYKNTFEVSLDLSEIEHQIEQLDGVKIARVELANSEWAQNSLFSLYDMVTINDKTYYASKFIYKTGNTEPVWPTVNYEQVIDGDIIWTKVNHCDDVVINSWEANSEVEQYSYVKKEYRDEGTLNRISGKTEPEWGDTIVRDNYLTWSKVSGVETTNEWEANHSYDYDDLITTTSGFYKVTSIGRLYELETDLYICGNYAQYSGSSEPEWDSSSDTYDNNLIWRELDSVDSTKTYGTWKANTLYQVGDEILVDETAYRVIGYRRLSGTSPTLDEHENLIDNEITWTPLDDTTRLFTLGWNEHLELTFDYSIVG